MVKTNHQTNIADRLKGDVIPINTKEIPVDTRVGQIFPLHGQEYELLGSWSMIQGKNDIQIDLLAEYLNNPELRLNIQRKVTISEIRNADPFPFGDAKGGHYDDHIPQTERLIPTLNDPEFVLTGFSDTYRSLDAYISKPRKGDGLRMIIFTEKGNKTEIVTALYRRTALEQLKDPNFVLLPPR